MRLNRRRLLKLGAATVVGLVVPPRAAGGLADDQRLPHPYRLPHQQQPGAGAVAALYSGGDRQARAVTGV